METIFQMRKRHKKERVALVKAAIRACDGNVSEAAKLIGIDRSVVYRELRTEGVKFVTDILVEKAT